jgi:hypothetical protein
MVERDLVAGAFHPTRPNLAEALECVRGVPDPAQAWKALHERGLIPESWLDEPRRRFPQVANVPPHDRSERLRWAPFLPRRSRPDVVEHAALFGSDVVAVEHAERCGLAFIRALAPWGCPQPSTILWVPTRATGRGDDDYGYQIHDTKPGTFFPDSFAYLVPPLNDEEERSLVARAAMVRERLVQASCDESIAEHLAWWIDAEERWAERVAQDARVPHDIGRHPHRRHLAGLAGRRYRELADPFALALQLFASGYAPLPSTGDVLVLAYPT